MNNQFGELSLFELTGKMGIHDEPVSAAVVPENPIGAVFERAELAAALQKSDGQPDFELADKILANDGQTNSTELHKSDVEKPHPDGVEVEQHGTAAWKYTYKDGSLIRMECEDPELPGNGRLVFDGEGNELHAA
jgi:hypothetical protein